MADKKISALGAAGDLDGTELIEVVQGGVSKKTTVAALLTRAAGKGITISSGDSGTINIKAGKYGDLTLNSGASGTINIKPGAAGDLKLDGNTGNILASTTSGSGTVKITTSAAAAAIAIKGAGVAISTQAGSGSITLSGPTGSGLTLAAGNASMSGTDISIDSTNTQIDVTGGNLFLTGLPTSEPADAGGVYDSSKTLKIKE